MDDSDKEKRSTAGLQSKINDLNRRLQKNAYNDDTPKDNICPVAGSLDFKAMYPSLRLDPLPKLLGEVWRKDQQQSNG